MIANLLTAACRGRVLLTTLLAAAAVAAMGWAPLRAEPPHKVLGLDRVIAFTYLPANYNPKQLRSATFIEPTGPKDWQDWKARGVVVAVGHTWFDLLRNPADKAVDILTHLDYGGNPRPVVSIDEFGFDFGGQTDQKSAAILRQTKRQRPDLALSVWEMRGPIPKVLAEAYRDVASLVMLECYVGDKKDYWWIATQVHAARMHGLLPKTIVALGLGTGGNPGELWARTPEELQRQLRFVRLIAPESPGVGFFCAATPELMAQADALCSRFFELPTDGAGLPDDVKTLARLFSGRHEQPALVASPVWVEPDRSAADPGKLVEPKTMRAYLMNVGQRAARNVKVRLRNPKDKGGDVFAAGAVAEVPPRGEAIAILPVTAKWNVWKTWEIEIEVPGGAVTTFRFQ
jgi:hypothetical protein